MLGKGFFKDVLVHTVALLASSALISLIAYTPDPSTTMQKTVQVESSISLETPKITIDLHTNFKLGGAAMK